MMWFFIALGACIVSFIIGVWGGSRNQPKPDGRVFGEEKMDWHHDQDPKETCRCMNDQDEAMCDFKACGRCDGFQID
jgi:hypothetical protein